MYYRPIDFPMTIWFNIRNILLSSGVYWIQYFSSALKTLRYFCVSSYYILTDFPLSYNNLMPEIFRVENSPTFHETTCFVNKEIITRHSGKWKHKRSQFSKFSSSVRPTRFTLSVYFGLTYTHSQWILSSNFSTDGTTIFPKEYAYSW